MSNGRNLSFEFWVRVSHLGKLRCPEWRGARGIAVTLSVVTFVALRLMSPLLKSVAAEAERASDPQVAGRQAKAGAERPRQI